MFQRMFYAVVLLITDWRSFMFAVRSSRLRRL